MTARAVTPLLSVGKFGTSSREHFYRDDADEAAQLIARGMAVLVPSDDVARAVLRRLGASASTIEERIQFSHTGRVVDPV